MFGMEKELQEDEDVIGSHMISMKDQLQDGEITCQHSKTLNTAE